VRHYDANRDVTKLPENLIHRMRVSVHRSVRMRMPDNHASYCETEVSARHAVPNEWL